MKSLPIILLILLARFHVYSQDTPIFTDRPNVTDAVNLIAPGTFQVELGYYQTIRGEQPLAFPAPITRSTSSAAPNLAVKFGLLDWLELRALTSYQLDKTEFDGIPDVESDGLTAFIFSPKFSLFQQSGFLPDISFASPITIPDNETTDFNLGLILLVQYAFDKLSIGGSTATDLGGNSGAEEIDLRYTLVGGYSITNKLGAFLEFYGIFNQNDFWFDFGFSYLVSNNFSVDVIYDRNLNGLNIQSFGFGFAWKTDLRKGMN